MREWSGLDYFAFLRGKLKLLLLAPALVGFAAFFVAVSLPRAYVSSAMILVPKDAEFSPQQVASILQAESMLRAIDSAAELHDVAERVSIRVGREGLVYVEVRGGTPSEAQQAGRALLAAWLKSTIPGERERSELEARRERARLDFANTQKAIDSIVKAYQSADRVPMEGALRVGSLTEAADRYFRTIQETTLRLDGLRPDVVVQRPTLPYRPYRQRTIMLALTSASITLVVLVAFLLVRHRWSASPNFS